MVRRFILSGCLSIAVAYVAASFELAAASGDAWSAKIDKRLDKMRSSKEERKFDLIGWAPSLRDAVSAAKTSKRPVFLFTHDGYINIGRC